jgi:phage tail-like protein
VTRLVRPYDFLLDGATGWRPLVEDRVSIEDGTVRLRLVPPPGGARGVQTPHTPGEPPDPVRVAFEDRVAPRGTATWRDTLFIADPQRHLLWSWRACRRPLSVVDTIGPRGAEARRLATPSGLAISQRGDLVVAETGNRRLQLFTLPDLALRRIVEHAWVPVDVASGPGGTLLVADQGGRIWRLDRQGRPDPHYAGVLPAGTLPERIAVAADGRAYVLAADSGLVVLDVHGVLVPGPEQLEAAALAWVADHVREVREGSRPPSPSERAEARAALLPPDLARELERRLEGLPVSAAWAQAMPAHLHRTLPPTPLRLDGDEIVAMVTVDGACCPTATPTGLSVDGRGRLRVAGPAALELLSLLTGATGPDPDGGLTVRGGAVSELLAEVSERPLDALAAYLASQPLPGPLCRSAVLPIIDRARSNVADDEALLGLVRFVLAVAAVDGTGLLRVPAADLAALRARITEALRPGPTVRAPAPPRRHAPDGVLRIAPLDSGRLANPWHRVVLDLDVPTRTSVGLFAFTSDVPRMDVSASELVSNPGGVSPWQAAAPNAREWLVQSPPGQYLHLALVLKGPGDRSPVVERISVYASRSSSLRFLPAVYSEDETSRFTLDRLLSLTDTLLAEIESDIEDFPLRLDPGGAPPEILAWLAEWFDLTFERGWTEQQRRRILAEIVDLYRWRGTVRGLTRLLALHTHLQGPLPRVVEYYRAVDAPALAPWFGSRPDDGDAHFTVLLPAPAMNTDEKRRALERVIAAAAPAHTDFTLRTVLPGVRLGSGAGSAVGLDTLLGSPRAWRLPAESEQGFSGAFDRVLPPDSATSQGGLRVAPTASRSAGEGES